MPDFTVFAPTDGQIMPIEQVPDPAFAEKMLGDGLAIKPSAHFVVAPFDGTITSIHSSLHAVTLKNDQVEILIHIGVESVALKGKGFEAFVKEGDQVKLGQKLIGFDPDFLAKNAPCNWVITVVTSPDGATLNKSPQSQSVGGKTPLFSLPGIAGQELPAAQTAPVQEETWIYSRTVVIPNSNGIHARPAAALAQLAKPHAFTIEIEFNDRRANLKSLVAVMGLGLARGAQIRLRANARHDQAAQALKELADFIESGMGEKESDAEPAAAAPTTVAVPPSEDPNKPHALTACAGLALGNVYVWNKADISFAQTADDPAHEKTLLAQALQEVCNEYRAAEQTASAAAKTILKAHQELLQDEFLQDESAKYIAEGKSAAAAFNEAIRASIDILKNTQNRFLAERIADLKDVRHKILRKLTGTVQTKPQFPPHTILVTEELLPTDLSIISDQVEGVVMAYGSPTAHVSILLRNKGIPSLVAAGEDILTIPTGTPAILNATDGVLQLNPSKEELQQAQQAQQQAKAQETLNQQAAHQPATTTDGVCIHISGNASNLTEAKTAHDNGADGLGLVRTEFLFYKGKEIPTEEDQHQLYQQITAALENKPVILRTLDIGGDKPVSYLPLPPEENPIVGLRGVRNYEQYRDVFLSQVRAMLRVTPTGAARIMIPMITFTQELLDYKKLIEEEKKKLGITAHVPVGIMIEVPAAALQAEQLAAHADFFSIGTNDLTQYTLAIDRGHKTLCAQADPLHPAVLRLIGMACKGAAKYNRPVGVCGAVAGDLTAVPLLIGLGVTELAVSSNLIAPIKALVRNLSRKHAAEVAEKALQCQNANEVRQLVKQEFSK